MWFICCFRRPRKDTESSNRIPRGCKCRVSGQRAKAHHPQIQHANSAYRNGFCFIWFCISTSSSSKAQTALNWAQQRGFLERLQARWCFGRWDQLPSGCRTIIAIYCSDSLKGVFTSLRAAVLGRWPLTGKIRIWRGSNSKGLVAHLDRAV